MRVEEIMTREVHTCKPEDSLEGAARIMWEQDTGFVPVVGVEDRLVGVITDRDICMAAYTRGLALASIQVVEAMANVVHTVKTTDNLAAAEASMRRCQVRRLPVVTPQGALAGVLSINDIARTTDGVQARAFAATIAEISEHRGDRLVRGHP